MVVGEYVSRYQSGFFRLPSDSLPLWNLLSQQDGLSYISKSPGSTSKQQFPFPLGPVDPLLSLRLWLHAPTRHGMATLKPEHEETTSRSLPYPQSFSDFSPSQP